MDGVQRYVTRPEQVEAVRVTEENAAEVAAWCGGTGVVLGTSEGVRVPCDGSWQTAWSGDWVIVTSTGKFVALANGTFQRRYVAAQEGDNWRLMRNVRPEEEALDEGW